MKTQVAPSSLSCEPKARAVVCRSLTKSYGSREAKVPALRGVDLELYCDEVHMLVGPSGCGKTTLISVIAGILDQDEGTCDVFGNDFHNMGMARKTLIRGEIIGFVFQTFNLLPTLTAAENVAVPLLLKGFSRSKAVREAKQMLDRVGLVDRAGAYPAQLSGGQQQRVAIARSLIHSPRLIVCDEPTSALDHETGHKVMKLLRTMAMKEGRALVIVTHDSRIFEFADRISRMDDGRIVSMECNATRKQMPCFAEA